MTASTEALASDVLARLADPATTRDDALAQMARLDGRELGALPHVFAALRAGEHPADIQAAARLLRRWAALPLADALPAALRAVVAEALVGDMNKLAAAALLESLGHPLDELELARSLRDSAALMRDALARLLEASARPPALAHALESIEAMPVDRQLALVDDLTTLGRPEATSILAALAHAGDPDVAVSAVAALDVLGLPDALGALPAIARHHADATVREQAARTMARLPIASRPAGRAEANGAFDQPPTGATSTGDLSAARVWAQVGPGTAGDRVWLVAAPPDARGARDVLTVLLRPGAGIAHYVLVGDQDEDAVATLRVRLAEGGVELEAASPAAARAALEAATAEMLAGRRDRGVAWATWRAVLPPEAGAQSGPRDRSGAGRGGPATETPGDGRGF